MLRLIIWLMVIAFNTAPRSPNIIKTETEATNANCNAGSGPNTSHAIKVINANAMTASTNYNVTRLTRS